MLWLWLLIASRSDQHNKITVVTAGIENILVMMDIISGIIYMKHLVWKYMAIFEQYLIGHWLGSAA